MLRSTPTNVYREYSQAATQASRLPTPAGVYKFPLIASIPTFPTGFTTLPATGWMAALVRSTATYSSANQVIMTLHGGSTVNTFGLRFPSTSGKADGYVRSNSVTQTVCPSNYRYVQSAVEPVVFSWSLSGGTMTYRMWFQGEMTTASNAYTTQTGNFTELRIGSRNGGSESLTGVVQYAEIGSGTFLTQDQMGALAQKMSKIYIITPGGQSNIQKIHNGVETSTPTGRDAAVQAIATHHDAPIAIVNTAMGGSSAIKAAAPDANPTYYWWDDTVGAPGPMLLAWENLLKSSCMVPDVVVWDQGEAESSKINDVLYPTITTALYKTALLNIFNYMRSRFPTIQGIGIVQLGIRTTHTNTGGIQAIVDVQNQIISENNWAYLAYARHDLALYSDGVHYTDASYSTMGARLGLFANRIRGGTVSGGSLGPVLTSASRTTVTVTATITHDLGTDFTPTTGIEGFLFIRDSDGQTFAPSAAVRATATTITLTLASDPGGPGKLYYMYDNPTISSLSNVLKDNGANTLPLRRGYVSVA